MPRAAQAFGSYTHPAPSKIDFDTRVESELIKAETAIIQMIYTIKE
jgi:ABC-2 type transport system permease protein